MPYPTATNLEGSRSLPGSSSSPRTTQGSRNANAISGSTRSRSLMEVDNPTVQAAIVKDQWQAAMVKGWQAAMVKDSQKTEISGGYFEMNSVVNVHYDTGSAPRRPFDNHHNGGHTLGTSFDPVHPQTTSEDAKPLFLEHRSLTEVSKERRHISDLNLVAHSDKSMKLKRDVPGRRRMAACNICSKRKSKCGGEPGSVCTPCRNSGRSAMCNWEPFVLRNGEDLVTVDKGKGNTVDDDTENLTNILTWHCQSTLLDDFYGVSSPFRFRSDPPAPPPRFPTVAEHPDLTYVPIVGADTHYNPHFDWSRYLPSAVALDRVSHDKALCALFLYYTPFCLRIIPDLFLKDMYRVLSVPRTHEPPKTAHYSAMLHNAIVALALAFSDDPQFRDLKARQHFIDAAKNYMEPECRKPTLAVVQALSFLATFYGSQGDQGLGFMYFGLSARVAQSLGLNLDCSDYMERGLMEHSDQVDRNWATWTIFTSDVCWSLYLGREFATSLPDGDFPLPYIDVALDEVPVAYGNLDPQPNHATKTFHANTELFVIGRGILEVNNILSKTQSGPTVVFDQVNYVDTKLNEWCASLPPELQLTQKSRPTATPHKLLLHLSYWWLFVLLHRPLFHYRSSIKAGLEIDHVKLCKRAANNIMEILKTWHDLFGLRFCPITLIQIAFSAGTVYLLHAVQACSGVRVAKKELDHAIAQLTLVAEYLHEIGRSWTGSNDVAEILNNLTQSKLAPLLEKIHVRDDKVTIPARHGPGSSPKNKKPPTQWR